MIYFGMDGFLVFLIVFFGIINILAYQRIAKIIKDIDRKG